MERGRFRDYDAFKAAHARHSAGCVMAVLRRYRLPEGFCQRARRLVERHEVGGDPSADLLKDADSLSFFTTNLPFYLEREGEEETRRRILWGIARLSPRARRLLGDLSGQYPLMDELVLPVLDA